MRILKLQAKPEYVEAVHFNPQSRDEALEFVDWAGRHNVETDSDDYRNWCIATEDGVAYRGDWVVKYMCDGDYNLFMYNESDMEEYYVPAQTPAFFEDIMDVLDPRQESEEPHLLAGAAIELTKKFDIYKKAE